MVAVFLTAKRIGDLHNTAALSARAQYAGARNRHLPSLNSDSSGVLPTFAVKLGTSKPWTWTWRSARTAPTHSSSQHLQLRYYLFFVVLGKYS